jgi:plastocyanin
MENKNRVPSIHLFLAIVGVVAFFGMTTSLSYNDVFAQTNSTVDAALQPNINAENIFNTKTMILGNNVQTLVILIPNDGHDDEGEDNKVRFLAQHFVPENAVINTGTTVLWFNGDVGHERIIDVKDESGSTVFNTGEIIDSQASQPFTFSNPGIYNYDAQGDPGVTMTGSVIVGNIQSPVIPSSTSSNSSSSSNIDTVGILMVPTQDYDNYIQQITDAGITVDNTYDFKDLIGGQEGTGNVQTLIVWTTGEGKDLDETLSALSAISANLPYS